MTSPRHVKRLVMNDESRNCASNNGEPWTAYELDFLREFWVEVPSAQRDEMAVAESLGRTLLACQLKAHYVLHGTAPVYTKTGTTTTTTTTSTYRGWKEGDGDDWD